MPTKKVVEKSTAMVLWKDKLKAMAKDAVKAAAVGASGNFLSLKSGVLSYQKAAMPGNKMNVIILDQVPENQIFEGKFEEGNPQSPVCYAFGRDAEGNDIERDDMVPHEAVENPINPTCKGCPNKQFHTAEVGKGKACGDVERLALITQGDLDNIANADVAYLKLPFFSAKEYSTYVNQLAGLHDLAPSMVITEISVHPDTKSQFRVKFRMIEPIEDEAAFEAIYNRMAIVRREIAFPYPKFEAPLAAAPRGRVPAARVAAPRTAIPLPASSAPRVGAVRAAKPKKY
jgi:hypothetical protein